MSNNDLDLPLLPSAEQIRRKEFANVRRGYDTEQVRGFLQLVAEQVETLERELQDLQAAELAEPQAGSTAPNAQIVPERADRDEALPALQPSSPAPDPGSDRMSQRIAHVLEAAEEEAAAAIADARAEAEAHVSEARAEADRIRVDAQARAEEDRQRGRETLARAKREAAAELMGLERRREELEGRLREMRSMLISAAEELVVETVEPDAPEGDVEVDARIEEIFGPRNRVDLPDLEPSPGEPDPDA